MSLISFPQEMKVMEGFQMIEDNVKGGKRKKLSPEIVFFFLKKFHFEKVC